MQPVTVERLGPAPEQLRALAMLRVVVFRSWPYLYEGDHSYEECYLRDFLASQRATLVVARVGDIAIGMATASPLLGQPESLIAPLAATGVDIGASFYFGESVLLPQFRGSGLGHRFFDEREAAAREAGATFACFCAVMRAKDDPRRPIDAPDLSPFWRKRGYAPMDGVICDMSWRDRGEAGETPHRMQFWSRSLEA